MEVGAVKQAYNNEVILLKKNLNQARIQTIHKLTRKAKTFTEKKAPEKLKEKFKRKAESAVKEVLLIKKIKPKEIAKFIVTHKGQLQDYLNKPKVDKEKACARLLIHKSLKDKYKFIRDRFSNVRIEDLLMSRQERLKLKKEAKEQQKQKKMKKDNKSVISEGKWNVENIEINNKNQQVTGDLSSDEESLEVNQEFSSDDNDIVGNDSDDKSDQESSIKNGKLFKNESESDEDDDDDRKMEENNEESHEENEDSHEEGDENEDNQENNIGTFVKITPRKTNVKISIDHLTKVISKTDTQTNIKKKVEKKTKDIKKNKNFKEKILLRKFKKDSDDVTAIEAKVVDPFFITATGENYMSVAEPRQPDEVKEIHKQGNRKLRRAVMFGHVPKIKPRQNNYKPQNNAGQNGYERFEIKSGYNNWSNDSNNKRLNSNEYKNNFEEERSNYNNRKSKFNRNEDEKPEKLHPSWEAKKKQSGILPFQGKKIVFDDS